jgi:hypothetical protein
MTAQWSLLAAVSLLAVARDIAVMSSWPIPVLISGGGDALLLKVLIVTTGADVLLAGMRRDRNELAS